MYYFTFSKTFSGIFHFCHFLLKFLFDILLGKKTHKKSHCFHYGDRILSGKSRERHTFSIVCVMCRWMDVTDCPRSLRHKQDTGFLRKNFLTQRRHWHRDKFESDYLRQFERNCTENLSECETAAQGRCLIEKNRGQKSCKIVPVKICSVSHNLLRFFL